jgi:hypothetical protein
MMGAESQGFCKPKSEAPSSKQAPILQCQCRELAKPSLAAADHRFEVIDAPWIKQYTPHTWLYL